VRVVLCGRCWVGKINESLKGKTYDGFSSALEKNVLILLILFLDVVSSSSTTSIIQCLGEVNTYIRAWCPFLSVSYLLASSICIHMLYRGITTWWVKIIQLLPVNKLGFELLMYYVCNLIVLLREVNLCLSIRTTLGAATVMGATCGASSFSFVLANLRCWKAMAFLYISVFWVSSCFTTYLL
jgi:hypothetical protein